MRCGNNSSRVSLLMVWVDIILLYLGLVVWLKGSAAGFILSRARARLWFDYRADILLLGDEYVSALAVFAAMRDITQVVGDDFGALDTAIGMTRWAAHSDP